WHDRPVRWSSSRTTRGSVSSGPTTAARTSSSTTPPFRWKGSAPSSGATAWSSRSRKIRRGPGPRRSGSLRKEPYRRS
ncbi:MAG: Cold shock protein of CSP family, partial [uncultured Gemmatimonadetes bacterium]